MACARPPLSMRRGPPYGPRIRWLVTARLSEPPSCWPSNSDRPVRPIPASLSTPTAPGSPIRQSLLRCLQIWPTCSLNPRFPVERNRLIARSADADLLVCDQRTLDKIKNDPDAVWSGMAVYCLSFDGEDPVLGLAWDNRTRPVAAPEPAGEPLACLMFTSGTTGKPKGVRGISTKRRFLPYHGAQPGKAAAL